MKHFYLILAAALLCSCNNFYQPVDPNTDVAGRQEETITCRFSCTVNGMTVSIHDFSIGSDMFYTFGDGEFYGGSPKQTFTHTYSKKGTYTIMGTAYNKSMTKSHSMSETIQVK